MALRWLSRVRSTSFLRKHPSTTGSLNVARFDQFRKIVSDCSEFITKNGIDADGFELIAKNALEDPVLQTQAKQALHSFATIHQIGSESRLPDGINLDLRIAILKESVVALLETLIPHKISDKLAQALSGPSTSERAHQVRAVIDCLSADIRQCVQHWVSMFVNLQKTRKHQDPHHYPLLFQLCAFVVLSQVYHRSKFISLRQLSDHRDEPFELGLILVQSFSFLFTGTDIEEQQVKHESDASLYHEISQLKTALESFRTQNQSLFDENLQLKNQMRHSSSRKQAISELMSDQGIQPFQLVWRRIQLGSRCPPHRYKHTAAYDASRSSLIVYGGMNEERQLDDVWRLQVDRCLWDRPAVRGRIHPGRHSHATAVAGGFMVVFGGFVGRFCTNETLFLDIATWKWSHRTVQGRSPSAREGSSMAPYDENSILLFGGRDKQQFFHDLWRFSIDDLTWTPLAVTGDYPIPKSLPLFGETRRDLWILAGGENPDKISEITLAEFTEPGKVVWRRIFQSRNEKAFLNLGVILERKPFVAVEKSPNFGEQLQPGLGSFKMTLSRLVISKSSWEDVDLGSECPGIRLGATLSAVSERQAVLFGGYRDGRILDELWFMELRDNDKSIGLQT